MSTVTDRLPTASAPAAPTLSAPTTLRTDIGTVLGRELRPMLHNPFSMAFSMIQPLFFLGLFAPLLTGVPGIGGSALQWFVPGIVTMSCLMGSSMTGSALLLEMQTGSHERMLVAPLSRSALLIGRALKEIVPMVAQAAVIVAVVTPFSFSLHPLGILVGLAILALFCVGTGALSYALALASKNADWMFWTVQQTVLFPLLLLAGMLLPVDDAPGWLRVLSALNPLTYIVDAERVLFAGEIASGTVLAGALAAALVAVVGLLVGSRAMRRSS